MIYMPRPKGVIVQVTLPVELDVDVKILSQRLVLTKQQFIREAVRHYVEELVGDSYSKRRSEIEDFDLRTTERSENSRENESSPAEPPKTDGPRRSL